MANDKENIIRGPEIPKYMLDSTSNLSQYFTRLLGEHGHKTALVDANTESSFTFENILNTSLNIASWLNDSGIKKSDIVGIFSENSIWYPSIILAVWNVGAVCALFNPMYNAKELTHVLTITKPKMMITSKLGLDIVSDTVKQLDFIKYVCPIDVLCNYRTFLKNNNFVPTQFDNNQTCVILFSSGTTGLPKGVELSHKSVFLLTSVLKYNTFVKDSDILMGLVPMFHGFGFLVICMSITMGCKVVVHKYFDENVFLKSIEVQKITVLFVVPPLMVFLAKNNLVDKYDLSSLNVILCGAAPLSKDIQIEVSKRISKGKTQLKVVQGYGMTELCMVSTVYGQDTCKFVYGSVGNLLYGMSGKVIDLYNGKSLSVNEVGEICFKGPIIMKGYYENPEETSRIIDVDGWLHTGDIGYYDENYNFYIIDRLKELIKYKGYQVAPVELESLLLTHPEIEDAAVIGLPNIEAGELPLAFIVKSSNSTLTEKDVEHFINSQVSSQKRLRGGVQFVDSIPKNPSGKILRRVLKSQITTSKL